MGQARTLIVIQCRCMGADCQAPPLQRLSIWHPSPQLCPSPPPCCHPHLTPTVSSHCVLCCHPCLAPHCLPRAPWPASLSTEPLTSALPKSPMLSPSLPGTHHLCCVPCGALPPPLGRRYNGAVEEKVRVMQERDTARDEVAALQSKREAHSRQQITVSPAQPWRQWR